MVSSIALWQALIRELVEFDQKHRKTPKKLPLHTSGFFNAHTAEDIAKASQAAGLLFQWAIMHWKK